MCLPASWAAIAVYMRISLVYSINGRKAHASAWGALSVVFVPFGPFGPFARAGRRVNFQFPFVYVETIVCFYSISTYDSVLALEGVCTAQRRVDLVCA